MKIEKSEPNTVTLAFIMKPGEWQSFYLAMIARKKTRVQRSLILNFAAELYEAYPDIEPDKLK